MAYLAVVRVGDWYIGEEQNEQENCDPLLLWGYWRNAGILFWLGVSYGYCAVVGLAVAYVFLQK